MRRRLIATMVLATALAVACAAIASAGSSTTFKIGNLEVVVKGGFSPRKLPRKKLASIHLWTSGAIRTTDGTHPPALTEVVIETDKNGTINARGLPVCRLSRIKGTTTKVARKACGRALVGEGKTDVEVKFPEMLPFIAHSKLLAFNGGVRGGKTTILIHAYLSNPVTAAVLTTVKVSKIHRGRYGTKSVAKIPLIAGGDGSVRSFNLKLFRKFKRRGKTQSYLLARCRDGKLKARTKVFLTDFVEGTGKVQTPIGALSFPCTPKG
ncbi:MAG: hypothetical protein ACM3N0_00765 [Chloroflexota bacterium]